MDASKKDGYAFDGEFVDPEEAAQVRTGSMVLILRDKAGELLQQDLATLQRLLAACDDEVLVAKLLAS